MKQLIRIFSDVERLRARVNQPAHAREPRRLGDINDGDEIHLKAGVDVIDVRFPHRCRQMNHTFGTTLLKSIDQRRQITDIAANHGKSLPVTCRI